MIEVKLPSFQVKKTILTSKTYNRLGIEQLIMIPIDESDEHNIDKLYTDQVKSVIIQNYTLTKNNITSYGNINIKNNSKDYQILDRLILNGFSIHKGQKIPDNYDYENHCCYINKDKKSSYLDSPTLQMDNIKWITTKSIAKVIQFNHGILGKPNKVVIFTNFIYNKK